MRYAVRYICEHQTDHDGFAHFVALSDARRFRDSINEIEGVMFEVFNLVTGEVIA